MAEFELFQSLPKEAIESLLNQAHFMKRRKGEMLVHKGDAVSGVFLVIHGTLRVFGIHASGREATLYRVSDNQMCVLSLNSAFSNTRYPAWVCVESTNTEVAILPGLVFRQLLQEEPTIQRLVIDSLATMVSGLLLRLDESMLSNLRDRIMSFLLCNADVQGRVKVTHQELAAHLGSSREVVSRELRQLRLNKQVSTSRNLITIAPHTIHQFWRAQSSFTS